MRNLAFVPLFFCAFQPLAGGVITQLSCVLEEVSASSRATVAESTTAMNPGSCSLTYPYLGETASVQTFEAGSGLATDLGTIGFRGSFIASASFAGGFGNPGGVDGYARWQAVAQGKFKTPGPVRPGVLVVESEHVFATRDIASSSVSFSVASYSDEVPWSEVPGVLHSWQFPVELGKPFDFLLHFDSTVQSDLSRTVHSAGWASVTLSVSAFDPNEQPVAIRPVAVPEPSTGAVCAIGLAAIVLRRRRRGIV